MRRFNFWLPIELFNRIKLMAQFYGVHVSKMMIQLLELGYIDMLKGGSYNETINK